MLDDVDAFTPFEGKNGQLYIGRASALDLVDLFGKQASSARLFHWWKTFERRGRELKRRGIPYVVNFAPSAHIVCESALPDDLRGRLRSPVPALIKLGALDNVTFIDSLPALQNAAGEWDVYRKTDSHWSHYGAFLAYLDACRQIQSLVSLAPLEPNDVTFTLTRGYGDLSVFMVPEGPAEYFPQSHIADRRAANPVKKKIVVARNRLLEFSSSACSTSALFFHDSYMTAQAAFWNRTFGRSLFVGITSRVFLDAVDSWRPDIVITEMADHRLFQPPQDHEPWTFYDEFEGDYMSPAGRRIASALLDLRQMKIVSAAEAIAGIENEAGFDSHHARIAAQILVSNRAFERAVEMARLAVADKAPTASQLWIAAYCEAYNGNPEAAVNYATWSLGQDSDNAAFAAFLASLLIGLERWSDAATLLENITPRLSDSPELWRSLEIVRTARGDVTGAAQANLARRALLE